MRLILPLFISAALPAGAALAQDIYESLPLVCQGTAPKWDMVVTEDDTVFDHLIASSDMDIALVTTAQDADWPAALTLIGRGDSAILIVEPAACDTGELSARVLTQRGETPLLLTGCCSIQN